MAYLQPLLSPAYQLDMPLLQAACRRGSMDFLAVEAILKGPEVLLPDGMEFRQGSEVRREARTRWWNADATTFRHAAIVDEASQPHLPHRVIDVCLRDRAVAAQILEDVLKLIAEL